MTRLAIQFHPRIYPSSQSICSRWQIFLLILLFHIYPYLSIWDACIGRLGSNEEMDGLVSGRKYVTTDRIAGCTYTTSLSSPSPSSSSDPSDSCSPASARTDRRRAECDCERFMRLSMEAHARGMRKWGGGGGAGSKISWQDLVKPSLHARRTHTYI